MSWGVCGLVYHMKPCTKFCGMLQSIEGACSVIQILKFDLTMSIDIGVIVQLSVKHIPRVSIRPDCAIPNSPR